MRSTAVTKAHQPDGDELLSLKVWLQLMKCAKSIESAVGVRFRRGYGQSLSRFDVLAQLDRLGGDWVAIGELARLVMASSGNITALLDRMEGEALIERRASPSDRRSFQVRMTEVGQRLFGSMASDHAHWIDATLTGISEDDRRRLIDLLIAVRRRFEADALPPESQDP